MLAAVDVCAVISVGYHWNVLQKQADRFLRFNVLLDKVVCPSQTRGILTSKNNIFHSVNNEEPFLRSFRREAGVVL